MTMTLSHKGHIGKHDWVKEGILDIYIWIRFFNFKNIELSE